MKFKNRIPRTKKFLAGALAAALLTLGFSSPIPVSAAEVGNATIHPEQSCSISLYKFDFTNASKDGIWGSDSYVSTGQYDSNVNDILGNAIRKGSSGNSSALGNGESSNGYAIKGCEFTYLKVADIYQYSKSDADGPASSGVEVLYAFNKEASADLLSAIGLPDGAQSHEGANALPGNEANWYYRSDILNQSLEKALNANSTTVKNALEKFVRNGGSSMPLTDSNGYTTATELPVGLYLLAETKVPEMVTNTTAPFFVSLPSTTVNGGGNGAGNNTTEITNGGHEWLYDVVLYPKNQTGIVTLEKEVRESKLDGGKHDGSDKITDGFDHNATASTGDILDYQIISTLPTITSDATKISVYNFFDTISKGLTYNQEARDVKIEFFTDTACTDKVASWDQDSGKFNVDYSEDGKSMTIDISEAGLAEINGGSSNVNGHLYVGYSNYTARVTYTAILNADAATIVGDNANKNEVVLTWKRSSSDYYDTLIDDAHVYTFGLNLAKQFSDMDSSAAEEKDMFSHVKFQIFNASDNTWVTAALNEGEGVYYVNGHTDNEKEASILSPVTFNGTPGQLVVRGLEDDEYILTEVETADGYTLLKDNIKVKITASDDPSRPCDVYTKDALGVIQNDPRYKFDGDLDLRLANIPQQQMAHNLLTATATIDGNKTTMTADRSSANALATMTVINSRGFDLPQTGDTGAKLLPIAGAVIAGASAVICGVYIYLKRKNSQEA